VRRFNLLICTIAALSACNPTCERTCRKVLSCDNLDSDRVAVDECKLECQSQDRLWADWADAKHLDQRFTEHKRCLVSSSCEQIQAGECYDAELFQLGTGTASTVPTGLIDTGSSAQLPQ